MSILPEVSPSWYLGRPLSPQATLPPPHGASPRTSFKGPPSAPLWQGAYAILKLTAQPESACWEHQAQLCLCKEPRAVVCVWASMFLQHHMGPALPAPATCRLRLIFNES